MDLGVGLCVHHHHQPAVAAGRGPGAHPQPILLQVPAHLPGGAGRGDAERRRAAPPAATREYCTRRPALSTTEAPSATCQNV